MGRSVERKDAAAKVTGEALYIDDYGYEGMLHACAVRSPGPRMRISGISDAAAKKMPGFITLVSASDVPGINRWPVVMQDCPFFPEKESKFAGETLALVLAETPDAARAAAAAVKIDCKELPFIDNPLNAMEKNSPRIYGEDNIFSSYVIRKGDAHKALKEADVTVEGVFTTNYQAHAYLETQGVIAFPEADGVMTVYGSMQCPFYVHDAVAQALGVSFNKVRIVQRVTGGGFGGKEDVPALVASHAAIAARKTGRPVKLVYGRKEDFQSMSKRHPSWTRISYGAGKDGTLVSCVVKYVLDGGAYSTLSPIVLWRGAVHAAGPYRIPDVFIEAYAAATNKVPCGAFRGFGQPQIAFANESLIDELALKLGMDPMDFRIKNALREGDTTATGQIIKGSCGLTEALEKVRSGSGWDMSRKKAGSGSGAVKKGIGVSANFYGVGLGARGKYLDRAGAQVSVHKDGAVLVSVGNTEMGQGAQTVLSQICAEILNAPYEAVRIMDVDTSRVPDSGPTVASRTTLMSGNAIMDACGPLKEKIFAVAAEMLSAKGAGRKAGGDVQPMADRRTRSSAQGAPAPVFPARGPEQVRSAPFDEPKAPVTVRPEVETEVCGTPGADISGGMSACEGFFRAGETEVSFSEAAKECWNRRLKMAEQGWYAAPHTSYNMENGQGDTYVAYSYSANVAEAEVDVETGETRVTRLTSAHDLGRAVNPQLAEGQVQGGAMQGLGYALSEHLVYKEGIMLNAGFGDYTLPSSVETPEFKTFILEHPYGEGPYNAKGFGESPHIGPAPAVANAIRNAVGIRAASLPMLPEKVWEKLQQKKIKMVDIKENRKK
ncbi:MAG: xanthine dehydrogenase family protein molybdopterin-binding subunit [bacterium]